MYEKEIEIAKEHLPGILKDIEAHKDSFISPLKASSISEYGNEIGATFSRANLIVNPSTRISYRIFIAVAHRERH